MEAALGRLPLQQRASLVKDELISRRDERGAMQACAAMWETRIQYYWTQRFPAHTTITLRQSCQTGGGRQLPRCEYAIAIQQRGALRW